MNCISLEYKINQFRSYINVVMEINEFCKIDILLNDEKPEFTKFILECLNEEITYAIFVKEIDVNCYVLLEKLDDMLQIATPFVNIIYKINDILIQKFKSISNELESLI